MHLKLGFWSRAHHRPLAFNRCHVPFSHLSSLKDMSVASNQGQQKFGGFTGTFTFTHLQQTHLLMRQMEDIWCSSCLCVVFYIGVWYSPVCSSVWILTVLMTVLSVLFDVIHHRLPSRAGEQALSPSTVLRAALPDALMKVGGPPQHFLSLPLSSARYPLYSSSTLRVLPTTCSASPHRVNLSCSLETMWC